MDLKNLSESQLIEQLEKLVHSERKITHHILKHIAEVDRRKLYVARAYSSLFDYLTKGFGYSPGAAMRRIDGARLLHEIPEVAEKIKDGVLQLSQVSQLQKAVRDVKKAEQRIVSVTEKRQVLAQMERASQKQTERIIAETFALPIIAQSKTVVHRDESVTLTITLSKQQQNILEKAKDLISHSVPGGSWAEVLTHLAEKELKRRFGTVKNKPPESTSVAVAPMRHTRKAISAPLRRKLLHPDARCEFRHSKTGHLCDSRSFLQIDHIHGLREGGGNGSENLQILCGVHNRWKYLSKTKPRRAESKRSDES